MFLEIVLNILSVLAIIVFGAFLVVVVADLVLCMFDDHGGIIFRRKKKSDVEEQIKEDEVKKDDIIVYTNQANPNGTLDTNTKKVVKEEVVDGHQVQDIDYDKAMEEQKALNAKKQPSQPAPRKVERAPRKEEVFWDDDKDDDFNDLLDEAIAAAKKSKTVIKEEPKVETKQEIKEEVKESKKSLVDEETKKELEELKELKEQQKKEIEEFKQLKEDFARQKEEELAAMKDNLDKAKAEELEKIRQEAIKEQEKLEAMQKQLEEEQKKLEEEKLLNQQKLIDEQEKFEKEQQKLLEKIEKEQQKLIEKQEKLEEQRLLAEEQHKQKEQERLEAEQRQLEEKQRQLEEKQKELEEMQKEEPLVEVQEPIIKETIIRDEEEINKLKYKNLMRMNNRLTRIIRDTERLQTQKIKEQERLAEEKRKALEKERQERIKEQEKMVQLQVANREKLLKQQENIRIKNEINEKLNNASNRVGKYKLDTKVVKVSTNKPQQEERIVEEVVTTVETIPHTDIEIKTIDKTPLAPVKASTKPLFDKEYYEMKLAELDEELRDAEKELRTNKSEYIPLTRIHKAYVRDSEKLRKKEMQVAKQKVALYGVNSSKINPDKKAKLDESLASLAELKDSVAHCEEVIRKNKDRYPVLEKNNKLITKQIERINEDIQVCEKAISYYNKHKES